MARKNLERICPVTGKAIEYNGRGRPPVYAHGVSAAQRRAHRTALLAVK